VEHLLTIEYGDDALFSTGLTRSEFNEEARFLLAAKLYELGRLRGESPDEPSRRSIRAI
jgi:hypothetical protein